MTEWLDLMLEEVARKQREAREAREEKERRASDIPDNTTKSANTPDQSK